MTARSIRAAALSLGLATAAAADINHIDLGLTPIDFIVRFENVTFVNELQPTFAAGQQVVLKPGIAWMARGLAAGAVVGPDMNWSSDDGGKLAELYVDSGECDQEADWSLIGPPRFLGVRYDLGSGNYRYAWFRAVAVCSFFYPQPPGCVPGMCHTWVVLLDAGIESEPNKPIVAGDKGCPSDIDGDDIGTINDFVSFQTHFALGTPLADCDENGELNIDDFVCFHTLFAFGC